MKDGASESVGDRLGVFAPFGAVERLVVESDLDRAVYEGHGQPVIILLDLLST